MLLHYNLDSNILLNPATGQRLNFTPSFFLLKKTDVSIIFYEDVDGVLTEKSIAGGVKTLSIDVDFDTATSPVFQISNDVASTGTTHTVAGVLTSERALTVLGADAYKKGTAEFKIFNPGTPTQIDYVAQFDCIIRNLIYRG